MQSGHTVFSLISAGSQISTAPHSTETEISTVPCNMCFPSNNAALI